MADAVRQIGVSKLTYLRINGEFTASIVIARCGETGTGMRRWKIRLDASLGPDITLAVRMLLAYVGAGSSTLLGGAIWLYARGHGSSRRRKRAGGKALPAAEVNG